MKAKLLVDCNHTVVSPFTGISAIEGLLLKASYLVVMDNGNFLGILTPADIVKSPHMLVGDCLHEKPRIDAEDTLGYSLKLMAMHNLQMLPVFQKGKFVGILCQRKIADYLTEHHADLEQQVTSRTEELTKEIDRRSLAEQQLQISLAEKNTLLHELYHRTKNTLQVIHSMLVLKATHNNDEYFSLFIQDIEQRILAIALVHQELYQSQNLSHINLHEYLKDMIPLLVQGYGESADQITTTVEGEEVLVLIDSAVPCGLIVCELMSNALKYAFPDQRSGEIYIRISRTDEQITLVFSDDGIGMPPEFDIQTHDSIGLKLLQAIVEQQLKGELFYDFGEGVAYTIQFQDNLYSPRVE